MTYIINTLETYDDPEVLDLLDDIPKLDEYEDTVEETYSVDLCSNDCTITNTDDIATYVQAVVDSLADDLTQSLEQAFAAATQDGAQSVNLSTNYQSFEFSLEYPKTDVESFEAEMESWREYYKEMKEELAQKKAHPNYGKTASIKLELAECDRRIRELNERKNTLHKLLP